MELQALLVLCGVGVAGVAVLLLMGLFSTSGTSYEEAMAQQRKAATEILALAQNKNKPKKNNKKANKKLAKKEKNKETVVTTGSEPESEAPAESGVEDEPTPGPKPHVEFSPPVVVDVPRDSTPSVKIRKRGKDPKVKPILLNKEDPSCISDPNTAGDSFASNHFEEMHPKDEFELLHSHSAEKVLEKKEEVVEKKDSKPGKQAKGGKPATKQPTPVEPVKEEVTVTAEAPKEQRKAKKIEKKSVSEDAVDAPNEEVVPPLNAPQPSELTTEKLLKQMIVAAPITATTSSPPGGKNKKKKLEPNVLSLMAAGDVGGVNVGELVRVVREAALSRTEIQILTDALLNKHHDPLPQHSEWTEGPNDPMQKLKKQLADKEKALADEIEASQALHAKLKELRTTLNAERGRAAAASRAAEQAAAGARAELHTQQARLQRLADDNAALAQEKHVLQSKLGAEGEAQAQRVQMEMHIQRLSESEAALVQQLNAQQAELNVQVVEAGQARCDANAARDATIIAQQHVAELAQQLQEVNHACSDLEQQRQCAVHNEQLAQQELRQAQERLAALTDLQNEVQRLTTRAQTAESNAEKQKEEAEKQKQQLSGELSSLREQLAAREAELAEAKLVKVTPAQNGLPPSQDQHKATDLAKVESVVESLRNELIGAQRSSLEQREQLVRLQDQLHQFQVKNNEALNKTQESQFNEIASILRAACPSAAPSSAADREWLQTFADNLKNELEKRDAEKKQLEKVAAEMEKVAAEKEKVAAEMEKVIAEKEMVAAELEKVVSEKEKVASEKEKVIAEKEKVAAEKENVVNASDSRLDDMEAQNEQLQALVDKYKRIIDDTEGVLSRLQQNVTTEEQRWAQQLADKQRELDELRQRTVLQMQNKIDALQADLQKAQAVNHNSFADSERLAEERLLTVGLSDKHPDVCNGPLQVELEEK